MEHINNNYNNSVVALWTKIILIFSFKVSRTLLLALVFIISFSFVLNNYWKKQETILVKPPGEIVDLKFKNENLKIHFVCLGEREKSSPLVIFEAGAMGWSSAWWGIMRKLSSSGRVCSWDRPGMGWSSPLHENTKITISDYPFILKQLLNEQNEEGKYLFVGHSMGALWGRIFASSFKDEVVGLVLIDPAHPNQFSVLPKESVVETQNQINLLRLAPWIAKTGILRFFEPPILRIKELPGIWSEQVFRFANDASHLNQSYNEVKQWGLLEEEIVENEKMKENLPVWVLSSERRTSVDEWTRAWRALHIDMGHISKVSTFRIVSGVDHQGIIFSSQGIEQVVKIIKPLMEKEGGKREDILLASSLVDETLLVQ